MFKRYFQTMQHVCNNCNKSSTVANIYEAENKNSAIYRYAPNEFSQTEKQLVKEQGIVLNQQNVFCCPHCNAPLDMISIMDNFVFTDMMEEKELWECLVWINCYWWTAAICCFKCFSVCRPVL